VSSNTLEPHAQLQIVVMSNTPITEPVVVIKCFQRRSVTRTGTMVFQNHFGNVNTRRPGSMLRWDR
jgi:hypothetical protein